MSRVLVISDTQIPFHHPDYLAFLKKVATTYKTNEVVHVGDEVDFHALSEWDHDPDGFSAGNELTVALKEMQVLYKAFPKVKVCTSNHTARPLRKAFKAGIPKAFMRDYHEFLNAPAGWKWADKWEIDGVSYQHGEGFSGKDGALKCALSNSKSTVIGHIHSHAGIQYSATPEYLVFGMNVGSLINIHSYAFRYGKFMPSKPIISCGVVLEGRPVLLTMPLNNKGRWTGKV